MKKLIIILSVSLFFIISILSCKTNDSNVSNVIEIDGNKAYLFAAAKGKDGSDIVCRFTAYSLRYLDDSRNIDLKHSFSSPVYIKESVIAQNENLKKFLRLIHNTNDNIEKPLSTDDEKNLYPLFDEAEKMLTQYNAFDANIGNPSEVCAPVLNYDINTDSFMISRADFFPFQLYGYINGTLLEFLEINTPYLKIWRDKQTGIYWTRGDSLDYFPTLEAAESYCNSLNIQGFKGSWRLPTVKDFYDASEYPSGLFEDRKNSRCFEKRYGKFCDYIYNTAFWVSTKVGQNISKSDFREKHEYPKLTTLSDENSPAQILYGFWDSGVAISRDVVLNPRQSGGKVLCIHN